MDLGKLDCKAIIENAPDGWLYYDHLGFRYLKVINDSHLSVWGDNLQYWSPPVPLVDLISDYGLVTGQMATREEIEQAAGVAPVVSVDSHYQKYVYRVKLSDQDVKNGFVDVKLDPYRVASVCGVGGGALEHCLKKAMRGTDKGHDLRYVYNEIIKAAMRGIEMIDEDLK